MVFFVLWMAWRPQSAQPGDQLALRLAIFIGGYVVIVMALAAWSQRLARRVVNDELHKAITRFNKVVEYTRWAIPVWYAAGLYLLGWGELLQSIFGPVKPGEQITWQGMMLPTTFLGILPPLLTWMALWWASFPADRAMREEALGAPVGHTDDDDTIMLPPQADPFHDDLGSSAAAVMPPRPDLWTPAEPQSEG